MNRNLLCPIGHNSLLSKFEELAKQVFFERLENKKSWHVDVLTDFVLIFLSGENSWNGKKSNEDTIASILSFFVLDYKGTQFQNTLWELSKELRLSGYPKEAFICVEQLILSADNSEKLAQFYMTLGVLMEDMNDVESAILYYMHAESLQPRDKYTAYSINKYLGCCFNQLQRYEEAERYFRTAINIDPEEPITYLEEKTQPANYLRNCIKEIDDALAFLQDRVEHEKISNKIPDILKPLDTSERVADKMKRCYELSMIHKEVKKADVIIESSWPLSVIDPEAEKIIGNFLRKHNTNLERYISYVNAKHEREGVFPWAIVFYNKEFRLAGHLASIRQNSNDFRFSAYSIKTDNYSVAEMGVPSVSLLYVYKKKAIQQAAKESEFFSAAWEQLADLPENQHWICIADSPSEEWVKQTSQNDDELYLFMTTNNDKLHSTQNAWLRIKWN